MKKLLALLTVTAFIIGGAERAAAATYVLDKAHCNIGFSVKHMVISNVKGKFDEFEGSFDFDEAKKGINSAQAAIKTASVNTGDQKRDDHLRSPEFFDAEKFPEITFTLKNSRSLGGGKMQVTGDLTIHGVTKAVTLTGEFLGTANDPWGNKRAGFTAEGEVIRADYGMVWNKLLDGGGLVVGDKVKLQLEIEGILKK
ncbi:MAG: polyisoprenoid-binding protein [Nitrospinae bacterium]|nr:polyisoprenoid-binding protein [Nitrospinota bacterium]